MELSTSAGYSNIWGYFQDIEKSERLHNVFKGDFLPYREKYDGWDDFWTGYYSTRLHLKRNIRHVFNEIQGTKTLLAINAIVSNNESIKLSGKEKILDSIQDQLVKAEKKWAILMHHDAITGTHTNHTEPSYYKLLSESSEYLDEARKLISDNFKIPISPSVLSELDELFSTLNSPEIIQHTIVNPSGYKRSEIINITLDSLTPQDNYAVLLITKDKLISIQETYFANLLDLKEETKEFDEITKLFFKLSVEALSQSQILILRGVRSSDWQKEGIKCSTKIMPKIREGPIQFSSEYISFNLSKEGGLEYLEYKKQKVSEEFTEKLTYYSTRNETKSGMYIFNPRHEKKEIFFNNTKMIEFEIPNLIKIVQVARKNEEKFLKTYGISLTDTIDKNQLSLEIQITSPRNIEISMVLNKKSKEKSGKAGKHY